jgi:hypothetical protein
MVFTYTRTFTTVLMIGPALAEQSETNARAAVLMQDLKDRHKDEIHDHGVQIETTDNIADLGTMRMQWRDVMPLMVPATELAEVNALLKDIIVK